MNIVDRIKLIFRLLTQLVGYGYVFVKTDKWVVVHRATYETFVEVLYDVKFLTDIPPTKDCDGRR